MTTQDRISLALEHVVGDDVRQVLTGSLVDTSFTESYLQEAVVIPALTSNVQVGLGDVSRLRWLFIETNQPLLFSTTIAISVPLQINRFLLVTTDVTVSGITGVFLSNAGNLDANVRVLAIGT